MTQHPIHWETAGTSRIPFAVYTGEDLHKKELERFFYKSHWNYVGLEAEVPNPGDFKRTVVGERSVIMTRAEDGQIHVVENVCAHRGMQFCRERHGHKKEFVCPYHQWSYNLKGDLQGVPFRRGVRQGGKVNGGMPADFDPKHHGLTSLKVATRGGVVFASFDHAVESLEDFMGPTILRYFDRLFNGRKLVVLGYNRQRIPGNWKLMQENIKDPYHPGLLHTWFVTFGLWRADNQSELRMDAHHRHAAMISTRGSAGQATGAASQVTQVSSFKESMQLNDASFLDIVPEGWWQMDDTPTSPGRPKAEAAPPGGSEGHAVPSVGATSAPPSPGRPKAEAAPPGGSEGHAVPSVGATSMPTAVMMTLFPSVIFQQQVNSVSTRHSQPDGHGAFDFVWTHFGFEDDTPEMTERRLRQSNLFGPAGFVSADDGEVIEFSQQAFETKPEHRMLVELGGRDVAETDHMVTETLIRGMYEYWRKVMEA